MSMAYAQASNRVLRGSERVVGRWWRFASKHQGVLATVSPLTVKYHRPASPRTGNMQMLCY